MQRIPQLDSVRAIAILAVFIHHAFGVPFLWGGVDLFFILSGFLITSMLLERRARPFGAYISHFYARRVRRILAPYLVFLLVIALLYGTWWLRHWYLYLFLGNLLYPLHVGYPHPVGVVWSLAVEEQFYFVWPFAVYFLNRRTLRWLCIFLILLAPLLRYLVPLSNGGDIYVLTPFRMDLLAAGGLLALVWKEKPDWIRRAGPGVGAFCIVLGCLGLAAMRHRHVLNVNCALPADRVFLFESSLILWFGFLLYALSGWRVGWLLAAPLRYVGTISYSMYLVHFCFLEQLRQFSHRTNLTAAVALALTLAYASLSWFFMEKRLVSGKTAPEADPVQVLQTIS